MRNVGLLFVLILLFNSLSIAQSNYGYGTVIGGQDKSSNSVQSQSMLMDNEQGVRVVLVRSNGGGLRLNQMGGQQGATGGVRILDVPKDTDYLELIMFYANIDPRSIRKNKIKILRVASTGAAPYFSKDIQRYWTTYNFETEYERGGPFELVRPGDIIIIEARGLFNRPIFDPLTDITFLLTLPTILLSVLSVYNTFFK
jgi:hypothetical protein